MKVFDFIAGSGENIRIERDDYAHQYRCTCGAETHTHIDIIEHTKNVHGANREQRFALTNALWYAKPPSPPNWIKRAEKD